MDVELAGGRIVDVQRSDGQLTLAFQGVWRRGLIYNGSLALSGVSSVVGEDPRSPQSPKITPGSLVQASAWRSGELVFETLRFVGPGEEERHRFTIRYETAHQSWRFSLRGAIRHWTGI